MKSITGWLLLLVCVVVRKGSHLLGLMAALLLLNCSNPVKPSGPVEEATVTHSQRYTVTIIFVQNDSVELAADFYYNYNRWQCTPLQDTTKLTFSVSWVGLQADSLRLLKIDTKHYVWLLHNNDEKVLRERSIQTYNDITVIEEG